MNYNINDFNDEGILNPGTFLIMILLYSSRYMLYGPLSIIASRAGRMGGSGLNLDLSFLTVDSPFEMLVSVPATIILFIMFIRSKESKQITRTIWRNGKPLLITGIVGQLVLKGLDLLDENSIAVASMLGGFVTLYALYYLAISKRVIDVFSMFPERKIYEEN